MTERTLNHTQLTYLICQAMLNKSEHVDILGKSVPLKHAIELRNMLWDAEKQKLEDELSPDAMGFPSLEAVYPDYVGGWKRWAESL